MAMMTKAVVKWMNGDGDENEKRICIFFLVKKSRDYMYDIW